MKKKNATVLDKEDNKPRIGYMCGVDFIFELENAEDGNHIYPSVKSLKKYHRCVEEDGIVKVEIKPLKWLQEPTVFKRVKK